ncbi:glycosyltransferase family 2 protein [Mycetocola sp. 2940]|uniref:glycosyltransferase family 2 protein n=1 Tax=Mycetocola sp. 2940 TaxID=3156452 RepID=UPI0033995F4C
MARLSVIIPVYNDAAELAVCLDALARQTRPADDIIVVDNASTDASAQVAHAAGARVVTEPVRGIAAATSAGFDAAPGAILARLDADSIPAEDWLHQVEASFGAHPEASAVTGTADFYGGNRVQRWFGRSCYLPAYFSAMGMLLGHPPLFGSNYAIRSEAWLVVRETAHLDRLDVHDDLDLSFQFQPGMTVLFEPALHVAVSARPFAGGQAMGRRVMRGVVTVALNVLRESPLSRRRRRALTA